MTRWNLFLKFCISLALLDICFTERCEDFEFRLEVITWFPYGSHQKVCDHGSTMWHSDPFFNRFHK